LGELIAGCGDTELRGEMTRTREKIADEGRFSQ
jgi:hypothetical protein